MSAPDLVLYEDDPAQLDLLALLLTRELAGHAVATCLVDPPCLAQLIDGHLPLPPADGGVVLLDSYLHERCVADLLPRLTAGTTGIGWAVYTGSDDPTLEARCRAAGAGLFMSKPTSLAGARADIERIRGLLASHRPPG